MISIREKKLYKVLRNVGVKRLFIKKASTLDDLYLDDFDYRLLVFYFENEFNVNLKKKDMDMLTTLPAFNQFMDRK